MLNQPTSSPMMNTMLGFLSCAWAGSDRAKKRGGGYKQRQAVMD